jgi:hypothetical protein
MERRTFLKSGAVIAAGMAASPAMAHYQSNRTPIAPRDLEATVARLRKQFLDAFDAAYVENVIVPYFLSSMYIGQRPVLPMIDVLLSKENALPPDLWGLLSENWKPNPQDGVTVFLQALEKRGPDNARKRIYMSAMTPDLYRPMYGGKVDRFLDALLDMSNAGRPLMRQYLTAYWDLYWDLHLGARGDDIPREVRQIGDSFNTVLAYRDPTQQIVYDNYMAVRSRLSLLHSWIDQKVSDLKSGRTEHPEQTFVHYWLKNGGEGENFRHQDVIFECFHNFVAFSQWGNTIYGIMNILSGGGDADAQAWFAKTMQGDFDAAGGARFTPLEAYVMELFRILSPNSGSISTLKEVRMPPFERHGFTLTPHTATSLDPVHWKSPEAFDPTRYYNVPTSHDIDEARVLEIGFARCPFERKSVAVADGRAASMNNSGFGTVYGVADGRPMPVCDYAGFAPFGFGYRRCPGEQLTINVIEDFLRKTWRNQIDFVRLDVPEPEPLPIGPTTVIADDLGFIRPA